jgi:methylated-DNA-[protein]-cysteine S-methyltransferase
MTRGRTAEASFVWRSPIGPLELRASDGALTAILFSRPGGRRAVGANAAAAAAAAAPVLGRAVKQLGEYLAGRRRAFDLAFAPRGTAFQRAMWRAMTRIPYGETISYAELARRGGRPRAVRAAAAACARNPISLVVPCHRVVGSDGSLTGYGGGLPLKRRLLELEGAID